MTFSKSNSEQDSGSSSQINPQQRIGTFRHENVRMQPDVLNINQIFRKENENTTFCTVSAQSCQQ